jgi:hypothetical protein
MESEVVLPGNGILLYFCYPGLLKLVDLDIWSQYCDMCAQSQNCGARRDGCC